LRELHGLKGEARMMGFPEISSLVHEMEELLRATEPRGYGLAPPSVDALLVVSDALAVLSGAVAGEAPDVPKLLSWLAQATQGEQALTPAVKAPAPSAPTPTPAAPKVEAAPRAVDASIRITQRSLEVLTSTTTNLQQRARQAEANGVLRRQIARDLVALHRVAEDLGPAAVDLATRLGRVKELSSELNRRTSMLATEELKELSVLSEEVTNLRMVPLTVLFEPYQRMVRELAKDLGKDVELFVEGGQERVDRSVLEAMKDPLLHLVRNAVDHGLESREDRARQGKDPKGHLALTARREGDRLVLSVKDDGRGLSPALLRQVAVRKGLLDEHTASRLSDGAAIDLVFLSGFSSRDAADAVSGRGVGLDVVRSQLLSVGGDVTVDTAEAKGTTFELRVPVSLTVAPVLFVQVGEERLCLTASNVVRAFTVEAAQLREVAGRPAIVVGDEVLPFASVASMLFSAPERPPAEGELVLVLRGRGQTAALAVDRVLDERVQAVMPLKGLLARYPHLSGATPMSDGELALVLSAPHLVATVHGRELRLNAVASRRTEARRKRVLVVDDSPLTRELLVQLLESAGYQVVQAVDGAQAMDVLARETADIVVTDLEMPQVDGLELTRRLKAHATWRSLPVVIVTTRGSEADRKRGMEAGADGYVTKGDLVRQDLVDVVGRLLA
ncbi:MAG TPA: response regulator, partial [Archangium sp.]